MNTYMVIMLFWVYGSLVIYKIFKHIFVNLIDGTMLHCKINNYNIFVKVFINH